MDDGEEELDGGKRSLEQEEFKKMEIETNHSQQSHHSHRSYLST